MKKLENLLSRNPQPTNQPSPGLWNKASRRAALLGMAAALVVCATPAFAASQDVGGKRAFACYTANAYDGADLNPAIGLDPTDPNYLQKLLATVTGIYGQIVASDPPTRLAGLAREIAATRPEVAGLEEMWTLQTAPATAKGPGPFTTVFDWLQLLTNALAAEGAHYQAVVISTEADIIMPLLDLHTGGVIYGRLTDHEVILVRADLPPGYLRVSNPQTGKFATYLQIPSIGLSVYRGWCSVDVFTHGERFRFICSHLEEETLPAVQKAQALELLAGPANVPLPVMLVGDFNADTLHRNGTTTYDEFIKDGFNDAWLTLNPADPAGGLTWGHDPLLADPSVDFGWRIDLVLYRGGAFFPTSIEVMDPTLGRTQPPFWPSDHAAVSATFALGRNATHE
jgi:hypothetical protein